MRSVEEIQSFLMKHRNRMRNNPTPSEQKLKTRLELEGIRHVFQSIKFSGGTYRIFDFFFPGKATVVEVDGGCHDPIYDAMRDAQVIKAHKEMTILRFTNKEVDYEIDMVVDLIRKMIQR